MKKEARQSAVIFAGSTVSLPDVTGTATAIPIPPRPNSSLPPLCCFSLLSPSFSPSSCFCSKGETSPPPIVSAQSWTPPSPLSHSALLLLLLFLLLFSALPFSSPCCDRAHLLDLGYTRSRVQLRRRPLRSFIPPLNWIFGSQTHHRSPLLRLPLHLPLLRTGRLSPSAVRDVWVIMSGYWLNIWLFFSLMICCTLNGQLCGLWHWFMTYLHVFSLSKCVSVYMYI